MDDGQDSSEETRKTREDGKGGKTGKTGKEDGSKIQSKEKTCKETLDRRNN